MPDSANARVKRLLFRSRHMGMVENDILFGRFAEANLEHMSDQQLDRYEALLVQGDNDLYAWITGKEAVPEEFNHDVMKMIQEFSKTS